MDAPGGFCLSSGAVVVSPSPDASEPVPWHPVNSADGVRDAL